MGFFHTFFLSETFKNVVLGQDQIDREVVLVHREGVPEQPVPAEGLPHLQEQNIDAALIDPVKAAAPCQKADIDR